MKKALVKLEHLHFERSTSRIIEIEKSLLKIFYVTKAVNGYEKWFSKNEPCISCKTKTKQQQQQQQQQKTLNKRLQKRKGDEIEQTA